KPYIIISVCYKYFKAKSDRLLEHFTLEIVACGGQSPPAPISLRGFAGKPAQVGLYNFKVKML
ncbi:MAG: hypothetical protein LBQ51_06535, partial [Desulfovibrio sp.]|nr:hypothetical protein [Desulfovibrio sp.]